MLIVRKGAKQHDPVFLSDDRPAGAGRLTAVRGILGRPDCIEDCPADEVGNGDKQHPKSEPRHHGAVYVAE